MTGIDPRAVAHAPGRPLATTALRNQAPGYDPRSGEGARRFGGRFNPPRSFPVLYLCSTRACVVAELTRQASRQGLEVGDLLPRELWRVEAELTSVLDLTDDTTLGAVGVGRKDLVGDDLRLTQQLGEAAYEHQFQAILAPSATGVDDVLAVFPENLAGAVLDVQLAEEWSTTDDLAG
ncbi:MAG: hypothetical protein JJLCMIEE_03083 [Acidimicrobiales bacterium]|nr:MAG: RES domain-containing protein [Actinomycetota bacterium]MBV6509965.1 hypothetical protein [Acidimicrobiales bacterium]RIK08547.1 MAG: hypothetical protein DCC48_00970 [Acidobacteriota bacterium]